MKKMPDNLIRDFFTMVETLRANDFIGWGTEYAKEAADDPAESYRQRGQPRAAATEPAAVRTSGERSMSNKEFIRAIGSAEMPEKGENLSDRT